MLLRRRIAPVRSLTVDPGVFRFGDGTWYFFGEPVYPDQASARRGWRAARRAIWAETPRMRLPAAATIYDDLTHAGWDALCLEWNSIEFDLARVFAGLAEDEASIAAFERADPRGATSVADFLALWREDLARMRRIAEGYAAVPGTWISRLEAGPPYQFVPKQNYGDPARNGPPETMGRELK